jgi:hypothetical protein
MKFISHTATKVLCSTLLLAAASFAQDIPAQEFSTPEAPASQNRNNGGVIKLPEGVSRVISIDAHNTLLAELEDAQTGAKEYRSFPIQHVYSGGIAKVMGGDIVPTEPFVSPYFSKGGQLNTGANSGIQPLNGGGNGWNNGNNGWNNGANNGFNQGFNGQPMNGYDGNNFNGMNSNRGGFVGNRRAVPTTNSQFKIESRSQKINQIVGLLDRPLKQVEIGQ